MGRRGTKPKPTTLRLLDGDQPKRINRDEAKPPLGFGDPPEWLSGYELEGWNNVVEQVGYMRVGTKSDREAAALYAQHYGAMRRARDDVQANGPVIRLETVTDTRYGETVRQTIKPNPACAQLLEAQRAMLAIIREFGMTPSSRSTIKASVASGDDELLSFFNERRPANGSG